LGINPEERPEVPEALALYLECRFWEALPCEGGVQEQPWLLMQEFRVCASEEQRRRDQQLEAQQQKANKPLPV
jgi:hypothetical protein